LAYQNCTLFKPNLKELKEGLKVDFDKNDFKALKSAIDMLEQQLSNKVTMVTLSELGVVANHASEFFHEKAHQREIMDVSGAGDTVVSVASLAMAAGAEPFVYAALANIAGGLVCEKVGVVPIDKEVLIQEAIAKMVTNN
jgi:bifunctional ADP-heptose synthase (sugar kinase/adenylyltransferase)